MPQPPFASYQEKSTWSGLKIAGLVAVFGAFGGLIYYAAGSEDNLSSPDGSIPVISPEPGAVKVRAEDPGGMNVPNRDKKVFDLLVEAPLDEKIDTEELCAGHSGALACNKEVPQVQMLSEEQPAPKVVQPDTAAPAAAEQTEQILNLMAESKPAPEAAPVVEPEKATTKPAAIPAPKATPSPVQKVAAREPKPKVTLPAKPAVKPAATIALPATGAAAGWGVQLASYGSIERANRGASHYQNKLASELAGLTYYSETVEVNGRTYYRVQMFGLADRAAANTLCKTIKAKGENCLPVKR